MYFDNIITVYMATKKQKIRKRKTFRGGANRGDRKRKATSQLANNQEESSTGFASLKNVEYLLYGINREKKRPIGPTAWNQVNKAYRDERKFLNNNYDNPIPVTSSVAKPTNNEIKKKEKAELEYYIEEMPKTDREIRINQHKIMELEVQRTKLEDLLKRPEIQFQSTVESQMSRLSGNHNPTTQESIRGEIVRINDQITEENKRLIDLKQRLKAYEGFVDILNGLRF